MKDAHTVTVALVPGVCGNCRHWDREYITAKENAPQFNNPDYPAHWGFCRIADSDPNGFGEEPSDPASTAFVFGDHAGLMTNRNHGCTQWSEPDE